MTGLDTVRGGDGHGALLVLLHGLSGNSGVWTGLLPLLSGRRWLAADLPGHGRSPALPSYGYSACAEAVALELAEEQEVVVLGHSFGGVLGLTLAAMRPVDAVVTVGMRAVWPPEFTATLHGLAAKPTRSFGSRTEAAAFFLRINGLTDFVSEHSEAVERGIIDGDSHWRLAQDPWSYAIGEPPFDAFLGSAVAAGTSVTLAHGEHDGMVPVGDYDTFARRYAVDVVVLPGLGHNAHVEDPQAVAGLLPA